MFNYNVLNKNNFKRFIYVAYDDILDDYIRAKHINDFKLECFCRGYLSCLDLISSYYNIKQNDKILDKRSKLEYI